MIYGTHNSATGGSLLWWLKPLAWLINPTSKCQDRSIAQQLADGVKVFNLQVAYVGKKWRFSHGLAVYKEDVWETLKLMKLCASVKEPIYVQLYLDKCFWCKQDVEDFEFLIANIKNELCNTYFIMLSAKVEGSESSLVVPPMNIPNGLTELAKLFDEVLAYVKENLYGGTSTSAINFWMQICFPSASAAFEYEPSVNDTEQLDKKFTKHHWFLPTSGILARVYWYNMSGAFNSYVKSLLSLGSSLYWSCTEVGEQMAAYVGFSNGDLASVSDTKRKNYNKSVRPICSF